MAFTGAKVALYLGAELAVILRDDLAGLPYAGFWDFPGGGREGDEAPFDCALRETREELGLVISWADVVWCRRFGGPGPFDTKWFFVARLPAAAASEVVFGSEGQRWALMPEAEVLAHPRLVPAFQDRLQCYLSGETGLSLTKPPAA